MTDDSERARMSAGFVRRLRSRAGGDAAAGAAGFLAAARALENVYGDLRGKGSSIDLEEA